MTITAVSECDVPSCLKKVKREITHSQMMIGDRPVGWGAVTVGQVTDVPMPASMTMALKFDLCDECLKRVTDLLGLKTPTKEEMLERLKEVMGPGLNFIRDSPFGPMPVPGMIVDDKPPFANALTPEELKELGFEAPTGCGECAACRRGEPCIDP